MIYYIYNQKWGVIMEDALIGVAGVIVGIVLTETIAWIRNNISIKSNEKIANQTLELEMKKIQREYDLEQLNFLLKPIIFIYMESDQLREYFIDEDRDIFGKGIYFNYAYKINDIISEYSKLVSLEIKEKYLSANHPDRGKEFANDFYKQAHREMLIDKGNKELQSIENFSFDDNREFIDLIKNTLTEITKKYK